MIHRLPCFIYPASRPLCPIQMSARAINGAYSAAMELRELRYVIAIEKAGNLSRAAEVLHVSQPALSYAVRRLENELGVQVFDRHSGGVTPTVAGRDVIAAAKRVVREESGLVGRVAGYCEGDGLPLVSRGHVAGAGAQGWWLDPC